MNPIKPENIKTPGLLFVINTLRFSEPFPDHDVPEKKNYFHFLIVYWMRNYDPRKSLTGTLLDGILLFSIISFSVTPLGTIFHYFVYPETPVYFPTVLPSMGTLDIYIHWTHAIFVIYYCYAFWEHTMVICTLGFLYVCKFLRC